MSYIKIVDGVEVPMATEEIAERQAEELAFEQGRLLRAWADLRSQRNKMLSDCDWTQGKDITDEVSINWSTYRQDLRNLPQNTTDPFNPVWPVMPT